jgi:hypothetical protein
LRQPGGQLIQDDLPAAEVGEQQEGQRLLFLLARHRVGDPPRRQRASERGLRAEQAEEQELRALGVFRGLALDLEPFGGHVEHDDDDGREPDRVEGARERHPLLLGDADQLEAQERAERVHAGGNIPTGGNVLPL